MAKSDMSDEILSLVKTVVSNQAEFKKDFGEFKKDVKIDLRDSRHEIKELRAETVRSCNCVTEKLDKHVDDDKESFRLLDSKIDVLDNKVDENTTNIARIFTAKTICVFVLLPVCTVGWEIVKWLMGR